MTVRVIAVVALVSLQISCGGPDLKPFSDATAEMSALVQSGFEKTQAALQAAATSGGEPGAEVKCPKDGSDKSFRCQSKALDEAWEPTKTAMTSLVDYSDSLTALAESGDKGKETAGKLVDSVGGLASAVGSFTGPFASGATEAAKEILGKVIQMRAERDIRKAVSQAASAVDRLAPLLSSNFKGLAVIHEGAANVWEGDVLLKTRTLREYYESLLEDERRVQNFLAAARRYQTAAEMLRDKPAKIPEVKADAVADLKKSDAMLGRLAWPEGEAASVEARRERLVTMVNSQSREIAVLEPRYQQAVAELDRVREVRQRGKSVLAKGSEAIDAWQKAHASLRTSSEEKEFVIGFLGFHPHAGMRTASKEKSGRPAVAELNSVNKEMTALVK
jgi:hypothetical protein